MNRGFSINFRNVLQGTLGNGSQKISVSPAQSVMQAINRYRSYLTTTSGVNDSFIGAMTCCQELISDKFSEQSQIQYDDDKPEFCEIPDDMVETFISGINDAITNGEISANNPGITITDNDGCQYNIINKIGSSVVIDGKTVLYSYTTDVSKISEALVYTKDGKYYVNNFIRTNNFAKRGAARVKPDTIQGMLDSMYIIATGAVPSPSLTIMGSLSFIMSDIYIADDALTSYNNYLASESLPTHQNIFDAVSEIWYHFSNDLYPIFGGTGRITSIWNVIKDNIESSELNGFIARACNAIVCGTNKATELTAIFTQSLTSKFKSIRKFGSGLITAFNRGSVYGVGCYILSFVKALVSSTAEDDGTFKFTDDSRLVPQVYIAGILSSVFTVVSQVVGLIISIFSKIIGVAFMIIGTVISSFVKAINYDSDRTYAAINSSEDVIYPISPYGIYQATVSVSSILSSDLISLLEQGDGFVAAELPGGFLLAGPGSYDSDGKISTVRFEIHPSITNCSTAFGKIVEYCNDCNLFVFTDSGDAHTRKVYIDADQSVLNDDGDTMASRISELYFANIDNSSITNEPTNDRLSSANDELMRDRIAMNLAVCCLYLSCVYHTRQLAFNTSLYRFGTQYRVDNSWGVDVENVGNPGSYSVGPLYGLTLLPLGYGFTVTLGSYEYIFRKGNISGGSQRYLSWLGLAKQCIIPIQSMTSHNVAWIVNMRLYAGNIETYSPNMQNAIYLPDYDAVSFWQNLIISALVVTAVAVVATIAALKVRKVILQKRAMNQAKVAAAYDDLTKHPTKEKYEVYRKAVRKNNMWANFIGGSKFDMESYWNGATNTETGSTTPTINNALASMPINDSQSALSSDGFQYDQNLKEVENDLNINHIATLITGPTPI